MKHKGNLSLGSCKNGFLYGRDLEKQTILTTKEYVEK